MSSRVRVWLAAFCISSIAANKPPITEELTAVTYFPQIEKLFTRLHPETGTQTTDQSSTQNDGDEGSSAPLNGPDGSELNAEMKKRICEHISSSGFFQTGYSPDTNKTHLLMNHFKLSTQLFGLKKVKEEGTGRGLLSGIAYVNASRNKSIYIDGRKEPYIESMFTCVRMKEIINAKDSYEYYVSDREYNLSANPREYIAGRFLAIQNPRYRKHSTLLALAEQPATVVVPQNVASLYASLIKEHLPSEKKYPIIRRLSEDQIVRLCASVMSGIKKSFFDELTFYPSSDKTVECRRGKKIIRLKVDEEIDGSLSTTPPWVITCKATHPFDYYHLIQPDEEQNGVFVAQGVDYGVHVVRYYASGIVALTEVQDL